MLTLPPLPKESLLSDEKMELGSTCDPNELIEMDPVPMLRSIGISTEEIIPKSNGAIPIQQKKKPLTRAQISARYLQRIYADDAKHEAYKAKRTLAQKARRERQRQADRENFELVCPGFFEFSEKIHALRVAIHTGEWFGYDVSEKIKQLDELGAKPYPNEFIVAIREARKKIAAWPELYGSHFRDKIIKKCK